MNVLLISSIIAATLLGMIILYTCISDLIVKRTEAILNASHNSRPVRIAISRPFAHLLIRMSHTPLPSYLTGQTGMDLRKIKAQ
jgi:hypothetical protein